MRKSVLLALVPMIVLAGSLAACRRAPPAPPPHPHYTLGRAWQGKDAWFYPYERFAYDETGIATRETPLSGLTEDGEAWSAEGMTGSHQTLQLPAVVTVRNLLNGRIVRIRLTRRGPSSQGRVIALSPRAADLLGMTADTPVEVVEDEAASRALAETLEGAPKLDVKAAPVGEVRAESLEGGSKGGPGGGAARVLGPGTAQTQGPAASLAPLPAVWTQGYSGVVSGGPGGLYILLGAFSRPAVAGSVAARCGASVSRSYGGAGLDWRVRSGPYGSIAQADAALDRTRDCGVEGARIVVE